MESFTSIFSPESRNCGQRVKLGTIDQIAPRVYITMYIFFPMREDQGMIETHAYYKEMLHRTLIEIPQLTTTIRPCDNNRDEVELAYDGDRGCIFTYQDYASTPERRALWKHGSIEELRARHFPYAVCEKHLLLTPIEEYDYPPSLALQINFVPGGYIVTSMLSHTVGDGVANFLFWQTMTKHSAAMANGERFAGGPASISFCERAEVVEPLHESNINIDEDFPNWRLSEPDEKPLLPIKPQEEVETIPKAQYSVFYIDEHKMKALADFISTEDVKISAIEAIGSFLWQQITLARNIDTTKYPEAKLSITVDTRRCMDEPVLPTNYWGNFSEPNAVARIPTEMLLRPGKAAERRSALASTLSEACDRIRNAVIAVDSIAVRRLVGLLNQMPKTSTLTWNVDRWPGPDMLLVCVNFHHYYNLEFGSFIGGPVGGRFMIGDPDGKPDGRILVNPPRPGDGKGLEIALQYDTATIDRLQTSTEFNEFFVRRC